jgi:hypothetical protein
VHGYPLVVLKKFLTTFFLSEVETLDLKKVALASSTTCKLGSMLPHPINDPKLTLSNGKLQISSKVMFLCSL